jgi:hypothetical protein
MSARTRKRDAVEQVIPAVSYRERVIEGLEALRRSICGYPQMNSCDCKYGASLRGEQTGCPELRYAISVLQSLPELEPPSWWRGGAAGSDYPPKAGGQSEA